MSFPISNYLGCFLSSNAFQLLQFFDIGSINIYCCKYTCRQTGN